MKRLHNIYPENVYGRQVFVTFDHFTAGGQAVYNVEFIAVTSTNFTYMVRYSGVKAANRDHAAKIALDKYEKEG